MTASSKPWGIVLEWDEDGLTCCTWFRMHNVRMPFESMDNAQWYIDNELELYLGLPSTQDYIATPRQFS